MFQVFEGTTADEVWQMVASAFYAGKGTSSQASRQGQTHEILHAAISINDPRQRWVVSRNPPMGIAFALAEVIWIMAGRNDSAFVNYFNPDLPKYAGQGTTYHGAYGYRLRKQFDIDQLDRAYQALSKNPETRQIVLQVWDSAVDLPMIDCQPSSADIPCNIVAILKVRDGALEWTQIMRSNDVFRGLPYNVVQFTMMQEIMAGWLSLKPGSYNHVSDSLHFYEHDFARIDPPEVVKVKENGDALTLPKLEFDLVLAELERVTDSIVNEMVSAESLLLAVNQSILPTPYRNILCILCAEGVRKRKRHDLIDRIMIFCTNATYHQLYERWLSRFSG